MVLLLERGFNMAVNYTIKDKMVFLDSESKDNPLIPHLDSLGNSIASFGPPYSIIEGITMKISGKTAALSMSGKNGKFTVVKVPVDAILALASAIEEFSSNDTSINKETLSNLDQAIEFLKDDYLTDVGR